MIDLFGSSDLTLNLLFTLYFLAMLTQCLLLYLSLKEILRNIIHIINEGLLLLILIWISWFIATLKDNLFLGIALLPGSDLRSMFLFAVLSGLYLSAKQHQLRTLLVVFLLLLLLPVFDRMMNGLLVFRFAAAGLVIALSSLFDLAIKLFGMRNRITGLAIKEAIDLLPDGMLFARQRGQAISINRQARDVIESLNLSPDERFDHLWNQLSDHPNRVTETTSQNGLVIRLPSDRFYYFSRYSFSYRRQPYSQLHLHDVSKEIAIARQIQNDNKKLTDNVSELRRLLDLAVDNARRKTTIDSRARLHDIFSQRLSLMRVLLTRLDKDPDPVLLDETKKLLIGMGQELFYEPDLPVTERFKQLVQIYRSYGIAVDYEGSLPAAEDVADTWIKILREAFSNALRHAGATSINVSFTSGQNAGYQMTITNDGFCPDQLPREGNGLQSIRARLERFAGHLEIENGSQFTLRVSIP